MALITRTWREALGVTERASATVAVVAAFFMLATVGMVVAFLLPQTRHEGFLRLHYTSALGVDWFGPWPWLLVYPAGAIALGAVNATVAGLLAPHHRIYAAAAWCATAALQTAIAATTLAVLVVNIRA